MVKYLSYFLRFMHHRQLNCGVLYGNMYVYLVRLFLLLK